MRHDAVVFLVRKGNPSRSGTACGRSDREGVFVEDYEI